MATYIRCMFEHFGKLTLEFTDELKNNLATLLSVLGTRSVLIKFIFIRFFNKNCSLSTHYSMNTICIAAKHWQHWNSHPTTQPESPALSTQQTTKTSRLLKLTLDEIQKMSLHFCTLYAIPRHLSLFFQIKKLSLLHCLPYYQEYQVSQYFMPHVLHHYTSLLSSELSRWLRSAASDAAESAEHISWRLKSWWSVVSPKHVYSTIYSRYIFI